MAPNLPDRPLTINEQSATRSVFFTPDLKCESQIQKITYEYHCN